jgi:integrase
MSAVLENLPLRELVIFLMGNKWRRRVQNLSKTNEQVFSDYQNLIASSKSGKWCYETRRLLNRFCVFLGEYPPSIDLFTKFFTRYSGLAARTRSRYYFVFSAFFKWYKGEGIPFKIRVPKSVPQKVSDESFEKLLAAIADRKTHKKKAERDIILVETAYHTGLRREELSKDHLQVGDLQLDGEMPCLRVRRGKGDKDRVIPLNTYIRKN